MAVYKTNHQLLSFPAMALDRLSREDPLEALVDQVFISCKKHITKCPSVYFFATITHEMFKQLCDGNDRALLLQRFYALFSAKIAASTPIHVEQEIQPQPLLSFSQKYSIGLSKEKLNKFKQTLAFLIEDENFMQGHALSEIGLAAINQIIFTFSLHHENIDIRFMQRIIEKNGALHEKEIILKIVKECITSFSPRTGFTQEKAEAAKKTINEILFYFCDRSLEKKKQGQKEAHIIYEILSSQEKKIAFEKQLDNFFRFVPSPLSRIESQNLDSAIIRDLNPDLLKVSSLEEKIFLFHRLQQLASFEEIYKTFPDAKSCDMLQMLGSTYRTLMQLLPSAHFFLDNPLALNFFPAVDPKEPWDCFLHPLPLASKVALMQDCLINVPAYINHRFSDQLLRVLASAPDAISVFLGNRDQLDVFVKEQIPEFTLCAQLKSPSSFKFFIYESKHIPGKIKVFILNVTSPSRLTHLSYILKLSGLEIPNIPVWGSFDKVFAQERASLEKWSATWATTPKVLFLGTNISNHLGQDIRAVNTATTPPDDMLCRGNYMILQTQDGSETPVLSFSMPNGELAGLLTSFCLEKGVKSIVMVGAGGAVGSESFKPEIGDYITFSKSMLQKRCFSIPQENLHPMVKTLRTLPFGKITELHQTVASPLEENKRWLESSCSKNVSMVDVETGHIFQSLIAHLEHNPAITILPGLFVSDIVNDPSNTLAEKISPKTAFAKTPKLIKQVIHSINL